MYLSCNKHDLQNEFGKGLPPLYFQYLTTVPTKELIKYYLLSAAFLKTCTKEASRSSWPTHPFCPKYQCQQLSGQTIALDLCGYLWEGIGCILHKLLSITIITTYQASAMWQGSFTVEKIQPKLDYRQKGIRTELDSYCYESTEEERPAAWGGNKKGEAEQEIMGGIWKSVQG